MAPLQEWRMIDRFRLWAKGGEGGNCCTGFHRSRQDHHGKPDGGNGGRGADVILQCSAAIWDSSGCNIIIFILECKARGTWSFEKYNRMSRIRQELTCNGQQIIVAQGGEGGLGNSHSAKGSKLCRDTNLNAEVSDDDLGTRLNLGFPGSEVQLLSCFVCGHVQRVILYQIYQRTVRGKGWRDVRVGFSDPRICHVH